MAQIKYCQECKKAKREHFAKSAVCRYCGANWEDVEVPRSRYFVVALPFLILGVILHFWVFYDVFSKLEDAAALRSSRFTQLGVFILGLAAYIFAFGFQYLDSKHMEKEAERTGASRDDGADRAAGRMGALPVRGSRMDDRGVPVRGPRGRAREKDDDVEEQEDEEKGILKRLPKISKDSEAVEAEAEKEDKKKPPLRRGKKDKEEERREPPVRKPPGRRGKKQPEEDAKPPRKVARKIRTR